MGASCGQLAVHGESDGNSHPICTQTLGPFACMCMPKNGLAEGTQILQVGEEPGKLILRSQADEDALVVDHYLSVDAARSAALEGAGADQYRYSRDTADSSQTLSVHDSQKPGGLREFKNWVKDHNPISKLEKAIKGVNRIDYLTDFAKAVLGGRVLEACRLMDGLEGSGKSPTQFFRRLQHEDSRQLSCPPEGGERIRRLGNKYNASLEDLTNVVDGPHWSLAEEDMKGPRVDARVHSGMMQIVSVSQYQDVDILKAFAALCEVDVLCSFTEDNFAREHFEELDGGADESLVHMVKAHESTDNILQVSYIDALDEEHKMLWVSIDGQEVPHDAREFRSVQLPSVKKGYRRVRSPSTTYAIVPLKHSQRSRITANDAKTLFRLITISKTPLSTGGKCWYTCFPPCLSRRYFRKKMCKFLESFQRATASEGLATRMQESSRSAVYEQVRRHLAMSRELKKAPSKIF